MFGAETGKASEPNTLRNVLIVDRFRAGRVLTQFIAQAAQLIFFLFTGDDGLIKLIDEREYLALQVCTFGHIQATHKNTDRLNITTNIAMNQVHAVLFHLVKYCNVVGSTVLDNNQILFSYP